MFDKPQKTDSCLDGVKCNVEDCYYNSQDCGCKASKIEVSNSMLGTSTDCKTYVSKQKYEHCEGCE